MLIPRINGVNINIELMKEFSIKMLLMIIRKHDIYLLVLEVPQVKNKSKNSFITNKDDESPSECLLRFISLFITSKH